MVFRELKDKINKWSKNLLLKSYDLSKDKRLTQKPVFEVFFNERPGIKHPEITPTLPLLKYVHDNSPPIKIATMRLRESIFRRGFEWERKFESKCSDCKKEFEDVVQQCDGCGSKNIKIPDMNEIKRAEKFFKQCNIYDPHKAGKRKLLHLLKQIEDDINIYDDAYLIGIKEYWQDAEGDIKLTTLHQILRGNPVTMRLVGDEYGEPGGRWYCCLRHRDVVEEVADKKCPKCGRKLYEVHYVSVEGGGDNPIAYYIGDEVIHISKYAPTALYGFSPIVTLWQYCLTLTNMIEYIYRSYTEAHLPKGILAMRTSNPDAAFEFWRDVDDKLNKDPHYIPKMFLEGDGNGTGSGMEFVKFMDTLEEMQFIPVRDEIRRTIASLYGVTNIFIGDTSGVGGLNSILPLEPIIIKNKEGEIDILPIDALYPSKWSSITSEPINDIRYGDNNHYSTAFNSSARNIIDENIKVLSKSGWTKVKYIQKFKVTNKPCIDVETGNGSIRITEDHSIFKDGEAFKGSELKIGDKIDIIKPDFNNFNNYVLNEEFSWLLGLFVAEGNAYYNKKSVYPNCSISNNDYDVILKTIKIIEDNFGMKCKIKKDKRGKNYIVKFDRVISRLIVEHCYWRDNLFGSPNIIEKKVPLRILNGNKNVKAAFLDGYYEGDGNTVDNENQTKTVCGVHRTLMAGIQFLYHSLGYKTTQLYRWYNSTRDNTEWSKPVIIKILSGRYSIDKKIENEIYNLDKYNYSGYVYDIETEDHGFVAGIGYCHAHNSEDTQIDITNMAAESGIAIYNDHIMPEILKWLNINDWNYELQSPFEENIQRELNENLSKVNIMQSMLQAGFDVALGEEDIFDFKYSGAPKKEDTSGGFGGFGGQDSDFGANPEEGTPGFNESDIKMSLEKSRIYVKHPNEAPPGSKIQRGANGAYYYDTTPQRPHEEIASMNKRRRVETLLHSATEHYENLLEEYKHSKDVNPGHAMSLQGDLQETRQMIRELQNNYKELFGDQPEMEKNLEGRNININIQKYLGESSDNAEALQFQKELNKIFDEEISKILNSTKRFSGDDIKVFTKQVLDDAIWKMRIHTNRHIRKLYDSGQAYVGELVGKSLDFSKVDEMAIKAITERKVLWNAYANMEKELSKNINDIITESYKDPKTFSIHNMVNKMREATDAETYRLERIVRTETRTATQKGREMGFKKVDIDGKYRYNWAVKHDSRTSDICKEIEEEVNKEGNGRGVTLDRLNEILKTISKKHNGENWEYRDWTPHINCRSGLVRSFVEEPITKSIINDVSTEIKKELIEKEKHEEELKIKKVLIEKEEKERLLKEQEFKIKEQEFKIKEQELNLFNKKIALMDEVENMPEVI